jgi:hypothetical protein
MKHKVILLPEPNYLWGEHENTKTKERKGDGEIVIIYCVGTAHEGCKGNKQIKTRNP